MQIKENTSVAQIWPGDLAAQLLRVTVDLVDKC